MDLLPLIGIGLLLWRMKQSAPPGTERAQGSARPAPHDPAVATATYTPPGVNPPVPPADMVWVRLMSGGSMLMREDDPLRYAID